MIFVLAGVLAVLPLPTFFFYVPLFLVALILGIVAIAQERKGIGISIIFAVVFGGPVLVLVGWVLSAALLGSSMASIGANATNAPISVPSPNP
jgi:hypothetical protein